MGRFALVVVVVAMFTASCGSEAVVADGVAPPSTTAPPETSAQLEALEGARRLWEMAPPDHTVKVGGDTVAVVREQVVSLASPEAPSVDEVFAIIEQSILDGSVITVDYDDEFGFPSRVVIDRDGDGTPEVDLALSDLAAMPAVATLDQLLEAKALWEAQGLDTYRYVARVGCTCPGGGTFDVEAQDGRVVSFVPLDETAETSELTPTSVETVFQEIEGWFTWSADLIDEGIVVLDVRTDPDLGYPRWFRVAVDAIDDERIQGPITIEVTIDLIGPVVAIDDEPVDGEPSGEAEQALLAARALWEQAALEDYRYLYTLHCECPLDQSGPFEITVRGGGFWSAVGPLEEAAELPDNFMIDESFEVIAEAIGSGTDVAVTYDETFGYPLVAIIDTEAVAVDGGLAFSISEFEVIERLGFVYGTVLAGPQCPVQQEPPQPGCEDQPVASIEVTITSAVFGAVPVPLTTSDHGSFYIALEPGVYVIAAPKLEQYLVTPEPVEITVRAGVEEEVQLYYDTGIR